MFPKYSTRLAILCCQILEAFKETITTALQSLQALDPGILETWKLVSRLKELRATGCSLKLDLPSTIFA